MLRNCSIKQELENLFSNEKEVNYWKDTIFERYIKSGSTVQKGLIGEEIVKSWCRKLGYVVEPRYNSEHDFIINKYKIEVKSSLSNMKPKNYYNCSWIHISPGLDWDILILLTAKENKCLMKFITKNEFLTRFVEQGLVRKEVYESGKSKTNYYSINMGKKNSSLVESQLREITPNSFLI